MASFDFIPAVDKVIVSAALNATTAADAQAVGVKKKILLGCSGPVTVLFGSSTVGAPSASAGTLFATGTHLVDMGPNNTHVRVFNIGASAINYSVSTVFNA